MSASVRAAPLSVRLLESDYRVFKPEFAPFHILNETTAVYDWKNPGAMPDKERTTGYIMQHNLPGECVCYRSTQYQELDGRLPKSTSSLLFRVYTAQHIGVTE